MRSQIPDGKFSYRCSGAVSENAPTHYPACGVVGNPRRRCALGVATEIDTIVVAESLSEKTLESVVL